MGGDVYMSLYIFLYGFEDDFFVFNEVKWAFYEGRESVKRDFLFLIVFLECMWKLYYVDDRVCRRRTEGKRECFCLYFPGRHCFDESVSALEWQDHFVDFFWVRE
jgi:hypothetical protein